jgi:Flp pilus assembly secretin CpaC
MGDNLLSNHGEGIEGYTRIHPVAKPSIKPKGFPMGADHRMLAVAKARVMMESDVPEVVSSGIHSTIQMEKVNIAAEELRMKKVALATEIRMSSQAMTPEEIALQVMEMRKELGLDIKEIEYGTDCTIIDASADARAGGGGRLGVGGGDEGEDEGAVGAGFDADGGSAEDGEIEASGSGSDAEPLSPDAVEP